MSGVTRRIFMFQRQLNTLSHEGPTYTLKRKIAGIEKIRKRRDPKKGQFFVEVPESEKYLDTATWPMTLAAIGVAVFAKLLMMYDDSKAEQMTERKIKNAPPGQGTVRMLTREEWDGIQELRPRTPFESKLARSNARIRSGEPLHMEDVKNWTIDVLTDALTRVEESAKRGYY